MDICKLLPAAAIGISLVITGSAYAQVTLTTESLRAEDAAIWDKDILPVFNNAHPDINVTFNPTEAIQYDAALQVRLEGGTAGDIIECRAFDNPLNLYNRGFLASVTDLPGIENFPENKLIAWRTDDGAEVVCVPMAGTMHGFIYNQDALKELGLEEPVTWDEFYAVLDAIKEDGRYIPLAIGSKDTWALGTMGYLNIGPNFWRGEEGRNALIAGNAKLTDAEFLAPLQEIARWAEYMAPGYQAQSYSDSQQLFTLGRAVIYPAGSWEIAGFRDQADFEMGAFKVPVRNEGDTCYVTDHTDLGRGMNAATAHPDEVRTFLEWATTAEFSQLLANALPGFYPLSSHSVTYSDPLAAEFASWRDECESTIRMTYHILGRGQPNIDADVAQVAANVANGTMTPEEAAAQLQANLESWYVPAGK